MSEIIGTLGVAFSLVIITAAAIIFVLSFLMPIFVYLINNRMKELLEEQKEANQTLVSELQKLNRSMEENRKN